MTVCLKLLPYPQDWDGALLHLRLLAIPGGSPRDSLIPLSTGVPSFGAANFTFDVRLVAGLDAMPTLASASSGVPLTTNAPPNAAALFDELANVFQIDPAPAPASRPPGKQIKKHAPLSYRQAVGFASARTPLLVSDDTYDCAIHSPPIRPFRVRTPPNPLVPWGHVMSLVLRQPVLAEALGLVRPLSIALPTPDFYKDGGWLYVSLAPASDAAALVGMTDGLKSYAARVPPLDAPRSLFTSVLFPVAATVPPGPYDDLFQEVIDYDDGFAKAAHCTQPRCADLLREIDDGSRPINDIGVRLGWDDEQVTVWLNRQVDSDPAVIALDAPMGVFGYRVDARKAGDTAWNSLCQAKGPVTIGNIAVGMFSGELATETHPVQIEGTPPGVYWLPMYYANWIGPALVGLDIVGHQLAGGVDATDPSRVQSMRPAIDLCYGTTYEFRVRLMDHTGGGPTVAEQAVNPAPAPIASWPFRRFIRPRRASLVNPPPAIPDPANPPSQVMLARPLLGYPAYVFTGAPNAVADLLADLPAAKTDGREVALADPDVTQLQITVQVQALGLDTAPGGGTDRGYHSVYTVTRDYPADPAQPIAIQLDWQDVKHVDDLAPGPQSGPIVVPTSRDVRLLFAPVAKPDSTLSYFGADDVRFGPSVFVDIRKPAADERALFAPQMPSDELKAMILQPEPATDPVVAFAQKAAGKGIEAPGSVVERLAAALSLDVSGMTLRARVGRRVVFGCSAAIRHIIGPDGSTLTFASKGDLVGHWLVALRQTVDRDWSWDGLDHSGITITRDSITRKNCSSGTTEPQGETGVVGAIQMPRTINADALIEPQRNATDVIFFDAVDPNPPPGKFPGELDVGYTIAPQFQSAPAQQDAVTTLNVRLPITTPPAQIPRLVSAGIALSPYVRSADYRTTEARQRALWLELERPPDNPCDAYFCRILCYAPDPMLTAGLPVGEATEPPLPIDPELIRTVVIGQSGDQAGIDAMQQLVPSSGSPVHFIMPLPPGVHDISPELFGFFTYELRVGHARDWSTAQGRFGAPLRVTGVQHPAPALTCLVHRDTTGIQASAPFATPVVDGRVVRPQVPTTRLWIMLYAQVVQSDGADHRNVLLGHKPAQVEPSQIEQLGAGRFGVATWSASEIRILLRTLTLGPDNPLSCLSVETLPTGTAVLDAMGADLGQERILRTSPLVRVPIIC
jgi:hypothetical protein